MSDPTGAQVRFDDRVALVTGAGRGLGRGYAIDLAARGACVVVHDADGDAVAEVVDTITARGGAAVGSVHDLLEPDSAARVVEAALATRGRIDVVIANAGFLRDRTFAKMPFGDFEAIVRVHLLGTAAVAHAAWPHFAARGYGRLVFTTSSASLWGNFGQSNYCAAKAGVVGLMQALKLEGTKHGIRVNTIAPYAMTRLAAGVFDPVLADSMKVERVVALVSYLASERCASSGGIFEVGAGRIAHLELRRGEGVLLAPDAKAEDVESQIDVILGQPAIHRFDNARQAFDSHVSHLLPKPE